MKGENIMKKLAILLIGVMLVFVSCKKNLDQPDITSFPEDNVWSVGQILDSLANGAFTFNQDSQKNAIVKGYVIADETGGNIYRTFYLRGEDGKCIAVYRKGSSEGGSDDFNVKTGDHIGYKLYGSIISEYSKLPQIQVQEHDVNKLIVIYERGCDDKVRPISTTIEDINAGKHLCDLVKISDAQFEPYEGLTYAEGQNNTNRNLVTCSGEGIIVRTSGYASFAAEPLPEGRGTLTAIASVYNTTWQMLIRNTSDVKMNDVRCGGGGDIMEMPYNQVFTSSFGTYTTFSVVGDQVWTIDYSTAVMKGKVGNTFYENEDWLISSPVHIADVEHAKAVVNYVAQYTGPDKDVTAQISADYEYGDDPTNANWIDLNVTFENSAGWNDFLDKEISLDEYIGQTVTFAIKFVSSTTQSRTIEIKSIAVMEGEAGGGGGGTLTGDGTRENPYTAQDVITMNTQTSDGNKYWVKDYIVGFVDADYVYVFTSAAGDVKTNIILSSNVDPTTADECIPIQLPAGAVRDGLNLADNPGNYKQEVLIYGTLEKYFQVAAVKNVTYAEINGNSYGIEPGGGGTEYFNQTLTSQASFNTFTAYSVAGTQVWHFDSAHANYGAQMSGFENNTSYANEDWFISPEIDLSASSSPALTFEHTRGPAGSINVGVNEGYYTVWVTNNYAEGQNPNDVQWMELTGVVHATTGWAWVSSGRITIPEAFKTATCRIAFKYLSIDGASATWEVRNVIISE